MLSFFCYVLFLLLCLIFSIVFSFFSCVLFLLLCYVSCIANYDSNNKIIAP